MFQPFLNSLAENLADLLVIALGVGIVAAVVLYILARKRHVTHLRERVRGVVEVPGKVREVLAKALNADTAEVATLGTVTLVDIAWHYSMADPAIWDHFHGPAADHVADAIQNLDVLKASLGDSSTTILGHILESFKSIEAAQVFHDMMERLSTLGDMGHTAAIVLDSKVGSLVDSLAAQTSAAASAADAAASNVGLLHHVPLVTIGFASYRAWRRSQKGAKLVRNIEFATIEVTTRAGGALVGGQLGGAIGTAIVPGLGTIIGGVTGAVAGAVGGALLGEEIKKRHVAKAQKKLDRSLEQLGETYLDDPTRFRDMSEVFIAHERQYVANLNATRRRMRLYSLFPWRAIWPNEKLILLQETVKLAEDRLGTVKAGTIEALERLRFMRETGQRRQLGLMLWSNPALCEQLGCQEMLVEDVRQANDKLRHELIQIGLPETAVA